MTCVEAEDLLLEALDEALAVDARRKLDLHLASCAGCAAFAGRMRAVDVQLSRAIRTLPAPPSIAAGVRQRQRRERFAAVADVLPDLIHVAGCSIATLLSAVLLPVEASVTLAVGIAVTCFTYVVMALVRSSLEAADQPDW